MKAGPPNRPRALARLVRASALFCAALCCLPSGLLGDSNPIRPLQIGRARCDSNARPRPPCRPASSAAGVAYLAAMQLAFDCSVVNHIVANEHTLDEDTHCACAARESQLLISQGFDKAAAFLLTPFELTDSLWLSELRSQPCPHDQRPRPNVLPQARSHQPLVQGVAVTNMFGVLARRPLPGRGHKQPPVGRNPLCQSDQRIRCSIQLRDQPCSPRDHHTMVAGRASDGACTRAAPAVPEQINRSRVVPLLATMCPLVSAALL